MGLNALSWIGRTAQGFTVGFGFALNSGFGNKGLQFGDFACGWCIKLQLRHEQQDGLPPESLLS